MRTDRNIAIQIEKGLQANPQLQGTNVNVAVQAGEAILTGQVDKYCKKEIAKKLAKDVDGVVLVVEDIEVILSGPGHVADETIAAEIADTFRKNFGNAHKDIKFSVSEGKVWLDGMLKWKYQKDLAKECIACINGIKDIENNIVVPESIGPMLDEKNILAAIYGDHSIKTEIKVEVLGNRVVLKGFVADVNQKNLVVRLVRTVPGVNEIENFLSVDWM